MAFKMTPERWTGLIFGIVGLTIVGLIGLVLTSSEPSGLPITIMFGDVQGLRAGDPVQIAGVPIGSVESVRLGKAGEPVNVGVKIYVKYRKQVAVNSTAVIEEAALPNVPGQRAVEIINPDEPGDAIRPGSILEGQGGEFDLAVWRMREKVGKWGREIETKAEELAESARQAFEEADKRRAEKALESTPEETPRPQEPPKPDRKPALASDPAAEEPAPGIEADPDFHPEEFGRRNFSPRGDAADRATTSTQRRPWIEPETMERLTDAKEFIQEFISSDEFKGLVTRLAAFTKRLNDADNPPTPDEIIREWDGIKRDVDPLLERLEEVDREAAMEGLIAIIKDIEEEIGPLIDVLEERRRNKNIQPVAPAKPAESI